MPDITLVRVILPTNIVETIRVILPTPLIVRITVAPRVISASPNVPIIEHSGLRAIDTVGTAVQSVFHHLVRFTGGLWIGSDWLLIAGTDADDDDTVIRPHDYAAGSNEKIWVKTAGF